MLTANAIRLALTLWLASWLACAAVCAQDLWRFVHPQAKAVLGVDWTRLKQSYIGTLLEERMAGGSRSIPGFEFLPEVERVLISSPGAPDGDGRPEAPILIAVQGRFRLERVRALLLAHGARPQKFPSITIYRPRPPPAADAGTRDLGFVLLDDRTILIGDVGSLADCAERNSAFAPLSGAGTDPVLVRAQALEKNYDAWALIAAPRALAGERLMDLIAGGAGAGMRAFEAGLALRDGLQFDVHIDTESDFVARKLGADLAKVIQLAAKDKPGEPAFAELERKMKVSAAGATVNIGLRLNPGELSRNARLYQTSRARKPAIAAEVRPAMPDGPLKQVIRIEGLDGGTKEIPFPP